MKNIICLSLILFPLSVLAEKSNISFLNHNFDPLVSVPKSDDTNLETSQGTGLFFVQFNGKIKQQWLTELKTLNFELLQYYPDNTYLVWGDSQRVNQLDQLNHIRWSGQFTQAYKQSPNLERFNGLIKNVDVHFYNNGNVQETLEKIKSAGATLLNHYPAQPDKKLYDAVIQIDKKGLSKISLLPEVIWIGYIGEKPISDGESSSQTVAGNFDINNVPLLNYDTWLNDIQLDGSGVIWSITDTGVDYDHPDLNSRIVGGFSYAGCTGGMLGDDPSAGGHGTHVAGITGGDATSGLVDSDGFLYGLGVAPAYSIFAQNPICPGAVSWPPAGGWQELSKQAVLGGAIGSNNSWTSGEGTAHGYQASERTHDFMAKDGNFDTDGVAEEFMLVFSAGNSGVGNNTLTAPKEAKNNIVTAGTQTHRVSGDVDAMYSSSSRGPSVDGRFVPTIAAPGQSVASTRNDDGGSCGTAIGGTNGLYSFCSGTSMAAPHTSGSLVLITEWWRKNNMDVDPSVAMAKALLINTAHDITDGGPIPNFNEGWGRIELKNLFQSETPFEFYDQENILEDTDDVWETSVGVVDINKPLKITLVWSDAPGAIGANPSLVNNLDLEVDNGGETYLGNSFSNGSSMLGGTTDVINNMENVFINAPGGSATIRVKATNIAGDGVFFSGDETDQNFALVCSNCAEEPNFTLSVPNRNLSVCAPDDALYDVNIGSILSFTDPVTLSTINEPANSVISFSTNPVVPVGSSVMTISNTDNIAIGLHDFAIQGTSTTGPKTSNLSLNVFDAIPAVHNLLTPIDNATNVNEVTTFTWDASAQAASYILEVDDNDDFSSIDYTVTVTSTSHTMESALDTNSLYYWRVRTGNICGSITSSVFSFTTIPAPGDCDLDVSTPVTHFSDDVESGDNGWTTNGTGNTWEINGNNPFSGSSSWHAVDVTSITDQRLISPAIQLPSLSQSPITLQYQNHQTLEDTLPNCWDGGILEVSTDGGTNWNYVNNDKMLTDEYNGEFSGTSNPLDGPGIRAWCGDPQDWTRSVVNIDDYAGQLVQFRFRLGTDGSVGRDEGWKIDDIKVKSCLKPDLIFQNSFELPGL